MIFILFKKCMICAPMDIKPEHMILYHMFLFKLWSGVPIFMSTAERILWRQHIYTSYARVPKSTSHYNLHILCKYNLHILLDDGTRMIHLTVICWQNLNTNTILRHDYSISNQYQKGVSKGSTDRSVSVHVLSFCCNFFLFKV